MVHRELSVGFSHIFEFSWSSYHSLAFQSVSKCFRSKDLGRCLQSCWNIDAFLLLLLLFYFIVFFNVSSDMSKFYEIKFQTPTNFTTVLKLRKIFFRLVTSVGQRKILSPHEESNLRPSDLLRCSTTKPQRLFGEWDLLGSSNDTHPAYC